MKVAIAQAISNSMTLESAQKLMQDHGQELPETLFIILEGRTLAYLNGTNIFPDSHKRKLAAFE